MAMRSTVGEGYFNFREQSQTFQALQLERTPVGNLFNIDAIIDIRILMGVLENLLKFSFRICQVRRKTVATVRHFALPNIITDHRVDMTMPTGAHVTAL